MHDGDSRRRAARGRVARLASPVGLVMAGLCLLLPFMSASCASEGPPSVQWGVTYTGVDVVGSGRPEVTFTDDADQKPIHALGDAEVRRLLGEPAPSLPPQPLAWLAAALMVAALAATALPSRTWRRTFTGGLAVAAAIVLFGATVLARRDATDTVATVLNQIAAPPSATPPREGENYDQVRDMFRYGYGLWIAIAALAAVGLANTAGAGRNAVHKRDGPAAADS